MQLFPALVYLLCLAASLVCTLLLFRAYRRSRVKLLLWTALCFVGLALNNLFLALDMLVIPDISLLPLRQAASVAAIVVLLYGFIWEAD